mmetsp:Transcript_10164/g.28847  ORF Transcript_10164/g.28847 Transcript_10164/m.28847 type:complete len:219 (+) Transcript_10164:1569-2225(+)
MRGVKAAPHPCIMASRAPMDVSSDRQPSVSGRKVGGAGGCPASSFSSLTLRRKLAWISPSTAAETSSNTARPSRRQHSRSTTDTAFRTRYSGSRSSFSRTLQRMSARKPGWSHVLMASAAAARPLCRASQEASATAARMRGSTASASRRPARRPSRKDSKARSRVRFLKSRNCSKIASAVCASTWTTVLLAISMHVRPRNVCSRRVARLGQRSHAKMA